MKSVLHKKHDTKELDLSFHRLTEMPMKIMQFKNLTKLSLCYNYIKLFSLEINKFTKLQKLYLAGNKLKFLPILPKNIKELIIVSNSIIYVTCINDIVIYIEYIIGS